MKNWAEIYSKKIDEQGGVEKYLDHKVKEKKPFLDVICRYAGSQGKILEAGCGTGVISTHLSNNGYEVTAVDVDKDILQLATRIGKSYPRSPVFKEVDLFKLGYPPDHFDVVFSHGVLEHFSDEEIVTLLQIQLGMAKTLVVSIPSNYLNERDRYYGNERFMSNEKWEGLISQASGKVVETFGFHYILGWKKHWDTLKRGKIFGPQPYLGFVIKKSQPKDKGQYDNHIQP